MTIHRAGCEDFDFTILGTGIRVGTSTARRDAAYSRCSIYTGSTNGDKIRYQWDTPLAQFYFTCRLWTGLITNSNADLPMMQFGQLAFGTSVQLDVTNGDERMLIDTGSGLALTTPTSGWVPDLAASQFGKLTGKIVLNSDPLIGEISFWWNDELYFQNFMNTIGSSNFTGIDYLEIMKAGSTTDPEYSEMVVADEDTRDFRVSTLVPDGGGNQVEWTGDFTDVDEITEDQGDLLTTVTPDDVELMTLTDYGGSVAFDVKNVFVSARMRTGTSDALQLEDGTGVLLIEDPTTVGDFLLLESGVPSRAQLMVREGTTDGFGATKGLETIFTSTFQEFPLNPDTGLPWELTELDTMEAGIKAIS